MDLLEWVGFREAGVFGGETFPIRDLARSGSIVINHIGDEPAYSQPAGHQHHVEDHGQLGVPFRLVSFEVFIVHVGGPPCTINISDSKMKASGRPGLTSATNSFGRPNRASPSSVFCITGIMKRV